MPQTQGTTTPSISDAPFREEDTSRISISALYTGYAWYKHGLSPKSFSTVRGKIMYTTTLPGMIAVRHGLGICDVETALLQRHLIIDHLLKQAIAERGVGQVIEIACGLSPRGFRMKQDPAFSDLVYVEADLPDMVCHKNACLKKTGLKSADHHVVPLNILATSGEMSLEQVARKYLKPGVPTAIITEGLIYYFDLPTMKHLWTRIANLLREFNGGIYLSDDMPQHKDHFSYPLIRLWQGMVGIIARGRMHTHFSSDKETEDLFTALSFDQAWSHQPEKFSETLPIPLTRQPSFIRIIEAGVSGEGGNVTPPIDAELP